MFYKTLTIEENKSAILWVVKHESFSPGSTPFFWQGFLILLPLVVLVVLGQRMAHINQRYAYQEENRASQAYAQLLAAEISRDLYPHLKDNHRNFLLSLQKTNFPYQTDREIPTASQIQIKAPFYSQVLEAWQKNHLGFYTQLPAGIRSDGRLCAREGSEMFPLFPNLWPAFPTNCAHLLLRSGFWLKACIAAPCTNQPSNRSILVLLSRNAAASPL